MSGCFLASTDPIARFSCTEDVCYPMESILFDGTTSSCGSRGEITSFLWDFGDGLDASGSEVSHSYSSSGVYNITLTVVTEDGRRNTCSKTIQVLDALVVPTMFSTLQAAIDSAVDGDVVVVMPGTYATAAVIRGKDITLQSTDPTDPAVVDATILVPASFTGPSSEKPIVVISQGSAATVAGFTITGSIACPACATGAIYIRDASPTIRNNHIRDNQDGGITAFEADPTIQGNVFSNNRCTRKGPSGGAIHAYSCRRGLTITSNVFRGNSARGGGAIYVANSCGDISPGTAAPHHLSHNVFEGNEATEYGGGAVFVEYGARLNSASIESQNTFTSNAPDDVFYVLPPD